jgi:NAD(P)-dependent dehydrogenase (short-subunit alcohol dehydrogenase family)
MRFVIVGANRGIGLELVRQLASRGEEVVATARDLSSAAALQSLSKAHNRIQLVRCDVTSAEDRAALARTLGDAPIDVLILNAGVFGDRSGIDDIDIEDVRTTMEVNAVAPLAVLTTLLPALRKGKTRRVVAISSGLGSIGDNTSGGYHGYRMSKAALNMVMRCASQDLASEKFICVAMNPGWVQTDMGGAGAPLKVEVSVRNMLGRIDAFTAKDNGQFLDHAGGNLLW